MDVGLLVAADEADGLLDALFGLVVDLFVLSIQWYFRTSGFPVLIPVHFLPDALQDLKQSPIFFPSQVCLGPDDLDEEELDELDSEDLGGFVGLLDGLLELFLEQWYFLTEGSPVFIRVHFLPDALQVLKQSPIAFPSHVFPFVVVEDDPALFGEAVVLGLTVVLGSVGGSVLVRDSVVVLDLVVLGFAVAVLVGRLVSVLGFVVDLLVGELDELDSVAGFDFDELPLDVALGLILDAVLLQWYFRIEGSPVFIRVHFLSDALQVLKQSVISFPSQVDLASFEPSFVSLFNFFLACSHCHFPSALAHLSLYLEHSLLQSVNFSKVFLPSLLVVNGFDGGFDGFEDDWLEVGFEDDGGFGEVVFDVVLGFLNDEDPNFSLHPYVSGLKLTNEHLISFFVQ